jgi:hypothetical protein
VRVVGRGQWQPQGGERRGPVGLAVGVVSRGGEGTERRRRVGPREERVTRPESRGREEREGGRGGGGGGGGRRRVRVRRRLVTGRVAPEVLEQLLRAREPLAAEGGVVGYPVADVGHLGGGREGDELRVGVGRVAAAAAAALAEPGPWGPWGPWGAAPEFGDDLWSHWAQPAGQGPLAWLVGILPGLPAEAWEEPAARRWLFSWQPVQ